MSFLRFGVKFSIDSTTEESQSVSYWEMESSEPFACFDVLYIQLSSKLLMSLSKKNDTLGDLSLKQMKKSDSIFPPVKGAVISWQHVCFLLTSTQSWRIKSL